MVLCFLRHRVSGFRSCTQVKRCSRTAEQVIWLALKCSLPVDQVCWLALTLEKRRKTLRTELLHIRTAHTYKRSQLQLSTFSRLGQE